MIYFFYFNKEIFFCELIFNVLDVEDKLCFVVLKNDGLYEGDLELKICFDYDKEVNIIILIDNGIGMSCDDVIENLGIIVCFGIVEFFKQFFGDEKKDSKLIGQFGVGFYFVFIVVDKVDVFICCVGVLVDEGVYWEFKGDGEFFIEQVSWENCGIEIVIYLKKDVSEFVDGFCL